MKQRSFSFISFFLCADFYLQNFSNLKKDRERFGFLR